MTATEARERAEANFRTVIFYSIERAVNEGLNRVQLNMSNVDPLHVGALQNELKEKGFKAEVNTNVSGAKGVPILTIKW